MSSNKRLRQDARSSSVSSGELAKIDDKYRKHSKYLYGSANISSRQVHQLPFDTLDASYSDNSAPTSPVKPSPAGIPHSVEYDAPSSPGRKFINTGICKKSKTPEAADVELPPLRLERRRSSLAKPPMLSRKDSYTRYIPGVGAVVLKSQSKNISKWTTNRISCTESAQRYLETAKIGLLLDAVQTMFSILCIIIYVFRTYETFRNNTGLLWVEVSLAFYFAADYFLRAVLKGYHYVFSFMGLIDLATFVPMLLTAPYISGNFNNDEINTMFFRFARSNLAFLRFIKMTRFMKVFNVIRSWSKVLNITEHSISIEVGNLILSLLGLVIIGSGLIHLVENNMAGGNPMQFHETLYFILTTVSTVGYGDFVTKTPLGMFLIIFIMVISVVLIPVQSSKILEMSRRLQKTGGSYSARGGIAHVVLFVSSYIRWQELEFFLKEFFHANHGGQTYDVVIVSRLKLHESVDATLRTHVFSNRVKLLVGSFLHDETLSRALVSTAQACFVMAHKGTSVDETDTERDKTSILTTMSIKNYCTSVPVYVQLLLSDSLNDVLWTSLNKCSNIQVVCTNKLKLNLLARGCLCPGLTALLGNLVQTCDYDGDGSKSFVEEILFGCKFEVYPAVFHPGFIGMTYAEAALHIYNRFELLLFAYGRTGDGDFEVRLNPGCYRKIAPGDFGYVLADDFEQATDITVYDPREPIPENRNRDDWMTALDAAMQDQLESVYYMEQFRFEANSSQESCSECCYEQSQPDFRTIENHVIVGGYINASIRNFILPLRDRFLPQILPIILVGLTSPDNEIKDVIRSFPQVFWYHGSLLDASTQAELNAVFAHNIVLFSNPHLPRSSSSEIGDIDHLTISTMLAINSTLNAAGNPCHTTVELRYSYSLQFVRNKPISGGTSLSQLSADELQKVNTADGTVYLGGMLESVQVQSFYNPRLMRVLNALIMGSWAEVDEDYEDDRVPNKPTCRYFIQLLLVEVPAQFAGQQYGLVFETLVTENNWLPYGIYRGRSHFNSPIQYVFTNPPPTTTIEEDDHLFVFAVVEANGVNNSVGKEVKVPTGHTRSDTFSREDLSKFKVIRSLSLASSLSHEGYTPRPLTPMDLSGAKEEQKYQYTVTASKDNHLASPLRSSMSSKHFTNKNRRTVSFDHDTIEDASDEEADILKVSDNEDDLESPPSVTIREYLTSNPL